MIPLLLAACLGQLDELPVVLEQYDELVLVRETEAPAWSLGRVYFLRDGKVIADRSVQEEMTWTIHDGKPALIWIDYGSTSRIVTCDAATFITVKRAEPTPAGGQPWWAMANRRTDLKEAGR